MKESLGPYEIIDFLGRGGAATVYRARQVSLGRMVALKVLGEEHLGDEVSVRRFRREARAVGLLDHPNIVKLYDVGSEGDRIYIAMELVEGGTLEHRLHEQGPLDEFEALRIVLEVAHALEHAHGRGLIHRDVKPGNLLLGEGGVVKLADLELAKCLVGGDSVTREGEMLGTPYYIAPELIEDGPVDSRCDIYSLGCTLYHMLTGIPPFYEEKNPVRILTCQLEQEPEPVSVRAPQVSARTRSLVESMMCKKPDARVSSAEVLRVRLEKMLDGRRSRGGGGFPVGRSVAIRVSVGLLILLLGALAIYLVLSGAVRGKGSGESEETPELRAVAPLPHSTRMPELEPERQPQTGTLPELDRSGHRGDRPETTALEMVSQQARELLKGERFGQLGELLARVERESWEPGDREAVVQLVAGSEKRRVAVQRDLFARIESARVAGNRAEVARLCRRVIAQEDALASYRARQILAIQQGRVATVRDAGGGDESRSHGNESLFSRVDSVIERWILATAAEKTDLERRLQLNRVEALGRVQALHEATPSERKNRRRELLALKRILGRSLTPEGGSR